MARRWAQQSEIGRFLDPIADKLLVSATLFMLAAIGRLSAACACCRRWSSCAARSWFRACANISPSLRVGLPVSRLAKWKTAIQMVAIGVLIVGDAGPAFLPVAAIGETLLWIAAMLTLVTGYDYLRAGLAPYGPAAAAATRQAAASRLAQALAALPADGA